MAISLDELFSNTAVIATAVAAIAAVAAEESSKAVPAPEAQKTSHCGNACYLIYDFQEGGKDETKDEVIQLRVPICCDGCVKKMEKKLVLMDGVVAVVCDVAKQKVTVRGAVKSEAVLNRARRVHKRSEIWTE